MATKTEKRPSARERLLAASDELFYRDGVHSTGIDAVIERAGVAKGSLYYIFGGKDELVGAYLRGRHQTWQQRIAAAQADTDDPDEKILAIFDAIADYVSLPEFRGCPFENADAEASAGECQGLATKEYRDWLGQFFLADRRDHLRARACCGADRQTHRAAHVGGREGLQFGLIRLGEIG
jgi:AcrR family transcriptional regulator